MSYTKTPNFPVAVPGCPATGKFALAALDSVTVCRLATLTYPAWPRHAPTLEMSLSWIGQINNIHAFIAFTSNCTAKQPEWPPSAFSAAGYGVAAFARAFAPASCTAPIASPNFLAPWTNSREFRRRNSAAVSLPRRSFQTLQALRTRFGLVGKSRPLISMQLVLPSLATDSTTARRDERATGHTRHTSAGRQQTNYRIYSDDLHHAPAGPSAGPPCQAIRHGI